MKSVLEALKTALNYRILYGRYAANIYRPSLLLVFHHPLTLSFQA